MVLLLPTYLNPKRTQLSNVYCYHQIAFTVFEFLLPQTTFHKGDRKAVRFNFHKSINDLHKLKRFRQALLVTTITCCCQIIFEATADYVSKKCQ